MRLCPFTFCSLYSWGAAAVGCFRGRLWWRWGGHGDKVSRTQEVKCFACLPIISMTAETSGCNCSTAWGFLQLGNAGSDWRYRQVVLLLPLARLVLHCYQDLSSRSICKEASLGGALCRWNPISCSSIPKKLSVKQNHAIAADAMMFRSPALFSNLLSIAVVIITIFLFWWCRWNQLLFSLLINNTTVTIAFLCRRRKIWDF